MNRKYVNEKSDSIKRKIHVKKILKICILMRKKLF